VKLFCLCTNKNNSRHRDIRLGSTEQLSPYNQQL
jgi:hypothetical protein